MLRKNLRLALRFLNKNKLFTTINVLGLSIALAASFIILLYVINELSYDRCHKKHNRIYRVLVNHTFSKNPFSSTPYVLATAIKDEFPQIEKIARFSYFNNLKLKLNSEFVSIYPAIATDSEIFDIFTIPLIMGSSHEHLLEDKNSIVLSRKQAEKFFPGQNPVGKEIIGSINNEEYTYTVKGVFEDIPENSSLKVTCCINIQWAVDDANKTSGITDADRNWNSCYGYTWILLPNEINANSIEDQFKKFEKKYPGSMPMDHYSLQNLSDVYLHSGNIEEWSIVGDLGKIKMLLAIALIIVLVASSNYIILYTAMSSSRVKEIGIRKTFGAGKSNIRNQMLTETLLLSILVLPVSMFLMRLMLPQARKFFFHSYIHFIGSNLIVYILVSVALLIFISLISGLYTSTYLSRLKVLDIFKSPGGSGKSKQYFRAGLIILQLVVFCCFVACTLIIRKQYQFAIERDTGYYKKDILYIYMNDFKGYESYLNDVMSNPEVIMAAGVQQTLPMSEMKQFRHSSSNENDSSLNGLGLIGDYRFLETMGIKLLHGRYYSEEFGSDLNRAVILNEKEVKRMRLKEPIGFSFGDQTVIGVVKDFSPFSLHSDIPPVQIILSNSNLSIIAVHFKPGTYNILIQKLEAQWKKHYADNPFYFTTVEKEINFRYASEKSLITIVSIVTIFTLLISIFGLFGLTFFLIRTRTKEIGIKRVFGSSQRAILFSFLFEYNLIVLIATLLSVPITLHFMNNWLNNFASRINISVWVFVIVYLAAMSIVLLTVSFHSFMASRTNPVNNLRYE